MAARPSFAEAEAACLALLHSSSPQSIKDADSYLQVLQNQPFFIHVSQDLLQSQHAVVRQLAGTMLLNRLRSSISEIEVEHCSALVQTLLHQIPALSSSPKLMHSIAACMLRLLTKLIDTVSLQQLLAAPEIQQLEVWVSLRFFCSLAEEFREIAKQHTSVDLRVLQQLQQCSAPLMQQLCCVAEESCADSENLSIVLKVLSAWGNRLGSNCAVMHSPIAAPLVDACFHGLLQPPHLSTMAADALGSLLQSLDTAKRQPDADAFVQVLLQKLSSMHEALSKCANSESYAATSSVILDITVNHGHLIAARPDLAQSVIDTSLFLLRHPARSSREIVFEIFETLMGTCAQAEDKVYRAGYCQLLTALVATCLPYPADFVSWDSSADDADAFENHRALLRVLLRDCCTNIGVSSVDVVLSTLPQQFTWQQLEAVYVSLTALCVDWIHMVIADRSGVGSSTCIPQLMSFIAQHVIVDHAANSVPVILQARLAMIESCAALICRPGCELRDPSIQITIRFLSLASTVAASAAAFEKVITYSKEDILGQISSLAVAIDNCMPAVRSFGPMAARSAHTIGRALSRAIAILPTCAETNNALAFASESTIAHLRAAVKLAPGSTTATASIIDIEFITGLCRFISPRQSQDGISDDSALMQALEVWWPACSLASLASGSREVVEKLCEMVKVVFHALMPDCSPFLSLVGPTLVSILQSLHVSHAVDAAYVSIEYLGKFDPTSEQWALLKHFVHSVMGTGVAILEASGGFANPPGLGILSHPSLCVALLELTLRCCISSPMLLADLPCFSSVLMMVGSCTNFGHRNCCSIAIHIISALVRSPVLAPAIRPRAQTLFNTVCSTLPKIASLDDLRVAGAVLHGILQSPHGAAIDALLTGALMQPAYEQVSLTLKQKFVATMRINLGKENNFCNSVKDFALVRFITPRNDIVKLTVTTYPAPFPPPFPDSFTLQECRSQETDDVLVAATVAATPPLLTSCLAHPIRRHILGN